MKNISLNFFGEEVTINMPTDLASLRQQISDKFMFSPSDTAELVVSYVKDLGKKIIQTEQDFVKFMSDKIGKIDLDISQDSKLYKENFNSLQKETEDNKKELEDCLKKKEEIKKNKEETLKEEIKKIKEMEKQIKQLQKEKKNLDKKYQKDKKKFIKEEKQNNKKIASLQKKLGINNENKDKLKSIKVDKVQNMMDKCLKAKSGNYKKIEKLPKAITDRINKISKQMIQCKLKKMHSFEKELEKNKIVLKPEEKEFFMNYPRLCQDIAKRVNSYCNVVQCETKKLFEDIKRVKKDQKQILCPLKMKLEQKEKDNKKEETNKLEDNKREKKEVHWYVTCDGCNMYPLVGKRYKCEVCPNFDFCEKCYEKEQQNHMHKHNFSEKKTFFENMMNEFKDLKNKEGKVIHSMYICDGCGMDPIVGNRYKCTICGDFDYCEACEEKFRNVHKHPFLKIYKPSMAPVDIRCAIPDSQETKK